jgi:hypothetical protein
VLIDNAGCEAPFGRTAAARDGGVGLVAGSIGGEDLLDFPVSRRKKLENELPERTGCGRDGGAVERAFVVGIACGWV